MRTMTFSSAIAGTYAPPAVHEPRTTFKARVRVRVRVRIRVRVRVRVRFRVG